MKDIKIGDHIKMYKKMMVMMIIISYILIFHVHSSSAIQEKALVWSTGAVYTLTPSSNMATEGNYTIKAKDFPPPVRGGLSVNGTIIPETPVILVVTIELYKDILSNPNPIATFTLAPGDEYITSSQDLRITIDSMPGSEDSDWVYESYNPQASIRIQQVAIPNMDIKFTFTNTNGDTIDIVNPGDTFYVNIDIQNTGEDIVKLLSYTITPDSRLQSTSLTNKLHDIVSQLGVNGQFTNQIKLIAPPTIEQRTYTIDVNITGQDSRDILHYWNNSGSLSASSALDVLVLSKDTERTTVYLKEYIHVTLNIYNRGPIPIKNIHVKDLIPDDLKYVQNKVELENLSEISFDVNSIGADQSWNIDYFLKPIRPGIYVLPAFIANFSIDNIKVSNLSNEAGLRVYGPIIQLNKSVRSEGNNVFEIVVSANNIGNGPSTVIIDDRLPDNAILFEGNNHSSMFLNAEEEKSINYTISIPKNGQVSIKDIPPANATYYLGDYKFTTSSLENVIATVVPTVPPEGAGQGIGNVAVPTAQETEKKVVATIPINVMTNEKKSPGFDYWLLIIVFLLIFIKRNKK